MAVISKKISKKICMIGDFSVGKTSLIRRYVDGQFSDQYLTTVGVKISKKIIPSQIYSKMASHNTSCPENYDLEILIWDLEGSTRFQGIVPIYLQGAAGALIVADVTRESTIENLGSHIRLFQSINPSSPMIIVLNKSDLCLEETINNLLLSIKNAAYQNIISVVHTSAKENIGVQETFEILAHHIANP